MIRRLLPLALGVCVLGCVGGKGGDPKNDPDDVVIAADPNAATHTGVFAKDKSRLPKPTKPLEVIPVQKRLAELALKSPLFRVIEKCPLGATQADALRALGKPDLAYTVETGSNKGDLRWKYDHLLPDYRIVLKFDKLNPITAVTADRLSPEAFVPGPSAQCGGDTDCINSALKIPISEVDVDTMFGDPSYFFISDMGWVWSYRDPKKPFEEFHCYFDSDGISRRTHYYDFLRQMESAAQRSPKLQKDLDESLRRYKAGEDPGTAEIGGSVGLGRD